jgi:hypothetical protein
MSGPNKSNRVVRIVVFLATAFAADTGMLCHSQASAGHKLTSAEQRQVFAGMNRTYSTLDSAGIVPPIVFDVTEDYQTGFKTDPRSRTDPIFRDQVLPVLNGVRFHVTVSADFMSEGGLQIQPQLGVAPKTDQATNRVVGVVRSTIPMLRNVLQNWLLFSENGIKEAQNGTISVEEVDGRYRMTLNGPRANFSISMDHGFLIDHESIDTSGGSMTIYPKFSRSSEGLLLTDWRASFGPASQNNYAVQVNYTEVQGIKLPALMTLKMQLPGEGLMTLPFSIRNYQFSKR